MRVSYKLVLMFLKGVTCHTQIPKITTLQYFSNISRKRRGVNLGFCMRIRIKVFYKLKPSFLVSISRLAQSPQNKMFLIFLRDLKKERRDEEDFLQAFNHQAFLQVDTIQFW